MIQLTRFSLSPDDELASGVHSWPLKVVAVSNTPGLDSAIFVYHARNGSTASTGDIFECVASVHQMLELPTNAPTSVNSQEQIPYYRKDTLLFHCRSADEAADIWAKIQEDVIDLDSNWQSVQALEIEDVFSTE